jgi:hypothetical protein
MDCPLFHPVTQLAHGHGLIELQREPEIGIQLLPAQMARDSMQASGITVELLALSTHLQTTALVGPRLPAQELALGFQLQQILTAPKSLR